MLAHGQGSLLNASRLSASLAITAQSVTRYIDLRADLMLVPRLPPFHANIDKRLVKSPKAYVRESGLLHALLGIIDFDQLLGHPVVGTSWEGFAVENLISAAPAHSSASFYRTSAGAEIDLLLDIPKHGRWAIEIKRGLAPRIEKGFHLACEDAAPTRKYVVYAGHDRYPLNSDTEATGLSALVLELIGLQ